MQTVAVFAIFLVSVVLDVPATTANQDAAIKHLQDQIASLTLTVEGLQSSHKQDRTYIEYYKRVVISLSQKVRDLESGLEQQRRVLAFMKGRVRSGSKFYATNGATGTFNEAVKLCADAGGQLVMPMNDAENKALLSIRDEYNNDVWLGFSDRDKEGEFKYLDGKPLTYANWHTNQPDNYTEDEDCGMMWPNGVWNDTPCDRQILIVCEFK